MTAHPALCPTKSPAAHTHTHRPRLLLWGSPLACICELHRATGDQRMWCGGMAPRRLLCGVLTPCRRSTAVAAAPQLLLLLRVAEATAHFLQEQRRGERIGAG